MPYNSYKGDGSRGSADRVGLMGAVNKCVGVEGVVELVSHGKTPILGGVVDYGLEVGAIVGSGSVFARADGKSLRVENYPWVIQWWFQFHRKKIIYMILEMVVLMKSLILPWMR